jgi:prepilin-type N-terminal cleavage/methylation domain-containing protein/prepilin-type processing-associated H-X9-DG protein
MRNRMSGWRGGFTLTEVMVVVGIIALLMGLLLPALSSVKASSRQMASMSNLRQWGVGTMNFCINSKDVLPWEGFKEAVDMPLNFADKTWWANAIPPYVGQRPYAEISNTATTEGYIVPLPPDDNSIFIDPGAQTPPNTPYYGGGSGNQKQFFFCYVPNSQLNNTFQNHPDWGSNDPKARMRLPMIKNAEATILMLEMRTVKIELAADDPHYNRDLARHRADWKRFAARHYDGGHLMFADGHVAHFLNDYATTNVQGTRAPDEPGGDWNQKDLIWDPLGPAIDE